MKRRGQALVEMVLGTIILVTVIVFGIHFAELAFLSLKVEEASNFALWDATNHQVHDSLTINYGLYTAAINAAGTEAQKRYADFDGRSSANGSAAALTQALTEVLPSAGGLITVNCAPRAVMGLPSASGGAQLNISTAIPTPQNGDTGMACSASADMTGFHMPVQFLERTAGGFFNKPNWRPLVIHVCSSGLASGMTCPGRYSLLLDDWALQGPTESDQCYLLDEAQCGNQAYYGMVQRTYNTAKPGRAGQALAAVVGADPGIDESKFWMSFAGSDSKWGAFMDKESVVHLGPPNDKWDTTPWLHPNLYYNSWGSRTTCFMGMLDTALTPCH